MTSVSEPRLTTIIRNRKNQRTIRARIRACLATPPLGACRRSGLRAALECGQAGLDDLEVRCDRCSCSVIVAGGVFLGRDWGSFGRLAAGGCVLSGRIPGDESFEVDRGRGEQQLQVQLPVPRHRARPAPWRLSSEIAPSPWVIRSIAAPTPTGLLHRSRAARP